MTHTRKNILLAAPLYPPDIGGPATYTVMLERFLPPCGFDLCTVSFSRFRHLPRGLRHLRYGAELFAKALSCKTIFALDPVSVGVPSAILAIVLKKKFILKVVGDYAWEQGVQAGTIRETLDEYLRTPFSSSYGWRARMLARLERAVARSANSVIVPSEYLKGVVSRWGVSPERIVVIRNAALIASCTRSDHHNDNGQRRGVTAVCIITAGRLVPWKRFDLIIRILPDLLKRFPGISLIIAGDGPDASRLNILANSLGVASRIQFLGRLSSQELHRRMRESKAFVLMSTYEGLSHLLIEALALGVPIIASDAGGNREVLEDGRCGFLVPSEDTDALLAAIGCALADEARTQEYVAAGLRSAQQYTPAAHISRLCEYL